MTNEMFDAWIAEVMELQEHPRQEAISERLNELTAKQHESVIYLLQINPRTQTRHVNPSSRPIGPSDRMRRRLEEQHRNSR